jgi:hypothetical protein
MTLSTFRFKHIANLYAKLLMLYGSFSPDSVRVRVRRVAELTGVYVTLTSKTEKAISNE